MVFPFLSAVCEFQKRTPDPRFISPYWSLTLNSMHGPKGFHHSIVKAANPSHTIYADMHERPSETVLLKRAQEIK
jgi:shikimate 5-dehydrogenase